MDIDSPGQTGMRIGRVSHPPDEWWVAPPTNTDTPMPDINNPIINADEEVLNTSRNTLDNEEPKFYQQVISRPNPDLWHSAIEAEIDALPRNHTCDVVDRPINSKIVDSKWVFNIKCHSDGSVDTFKS
jgi:hypothetical protein